MLDRPRDPTLDQVADPADGTSPMSAPPETSTAIIERAEPRSVDIADPLRPHTATVLDAISLSRPASRVQGVESADWDELGRLVRDCVACGLCRGRRQTVFGVGPQTARWMIIGEAPGAEEDAQGEPFVGQAGRLLDAMLAAIGMNRQQHVFIANVLKCRPPGNRNPEPDEVAHCSPFLRRQLELVNPDVLLLMGRFAAQTILGVDASIGSLRGRVHHVEVAGRQVPTVVTYHPAYLLRTLPDKAKAWRDLLMARGLAA